MPSGDPENQTCADRNIDLDTTHVNPAGGGWINVRLLRSACTSFSGLSRTLFRLQPGPFGLKADTYPRRNPPLGRSQLTAATVTIAAALCPTL